MKHFKWLGNMEFKGALEYIIMHMVIKYSNFQ